MIRYRHLVKSSFIVIIFFGLGKITGLLRTRLVGGAFGTGTEFDAFTAANQLPEVFVTLISGGALAAAFIPVYSAYLQSNSSRSSARLANTILHLVLIALTVVSAAGMLAAPWVTEVLLVPDFDPIDQKLTAELMRIILLQTTLFGVSGVLSSILNAHQHFALPALAPVALDIGYIVGLGLLVPSLGIHGLAWGTVIGGVLHIAIQIPALIKYGISYRPAISIRNEGVREIIRLMGPRIVTLGSVQVADLIIIRLASGLSPGSTSGYFYGYYLMQLPETLLGTAIAIVVFPTLAELYNAGEISKLKEAAMGTLQIIWTLTIPAAALLVLLGRPAIVIFLQGGAFTVTSTEIVYGVLVMFSVRVVSEASLEILARLFYAQHDTRTPMFAALGWLLLNAFMAYALVNYLGVNGLALASTIAFTAQIATLYCLARRKLGSLKEKSLLLTLARSLLGIAVMSLIILVAERYIQNNFYLLLAGGLIGLSGYVVAVVMLGAQEPQRLFRLLTTRVEA